jgi:hypothetical protein
MSQKAETAVVDQGRAVAAKAGQRSVDEVEGGRSFT